MELIVPEDYIATLDGFIERIDDLGPRAMGAMLDGVELNGLGSPVGVAVQLVQLKQNIILVKEKLEEEGVAFQQFTQLTERITETPPVLDLVNDALVLAGY